MENLKDKYTELLRKKLDALNHMREITVDQVFTGDETLLEKEAEAFIALYEKRSDILSRIEKIDDALELLDPLDTEDLDDAYFQAQVMEFRQKMTELAKEMVGLDKANIEVYKKMSAFVRDNMKHTRQSIDLIQGYENYLDSNEGYYMDKKKV